MTAVLMSEERWTLPEKLAPTDPYRFALMRRWRSGPLRIYVGLNPSTASALVDDQTVRKWIGFCNKHGFGGFIAVNCFAWRATDPRDLVAAYARGEDLTGGDEGEELFQAMFTHPLVTEVVACWGRSPDSRLSTRLESIAMLLINPGLHQLPVKCFGKTKCGQPRHPLYLSADTPLETFTP